MTKVQSERKLCIALGNELLSDDALPLHIMNHLKKSFSGVDFLHISYVDAGILHDIEGYDQLLLIDTMKTNHFSPGTMVFFDPEYKQPSFHLFNYHDFSFYESVELGKQMNMVLPHDIAVIAIEIVENKLFDKLLSPKLRGNEEAIFLKASKYFRCFFNGKE